MIVVFVVYGTFRNIPTVEILRGGSFLIVPEPIAVKLLIQCKSLHDLTIEAKIIAVLVLASVAEKNYNYLIINLFDVSAKKNNSTQRPSFDAL